MKRNIIITLIFLSCLSALASSNTLTSRFFYCLSNCKQFTHDDGRKITVIMGWANRKCHFKEITHNRTISCALKPLELEHFSNEVQKQFNYKEGFASTINARPYFLSKDTCTVISRFPDSTGF